MTYPTGHYGQGFGADYGGTGSASSYPAIGATDFDVFFSDFSVPCVRANSYTFNGILDIVEAVDGSGPGEVITRVPTLTYPTSSAGRLNIGERITVNGIPYLVRAHELQDDGHIARAALRVP